MGRVPVVEVKRMGLFLAALIPQDFTFITQQCLAGIRAAKSELYPKPKPGIFT